MSSQSSIRRSCIDGSISTTLAEDVFTIVDAQIAVLNDFLEATNLALTDTGNAIVTDALLSIFRMIFFTTQYNMKSVIRNIGTKTNGLIKDRKVITDKPISSTLLQF